MSGENKAPVSQSLVPSWKQVAGIVATLLCLFGLVLLLSYLLATETQYEFTTWVEILGSAGSLVLTALIVLVYLKLANLDAKQVAIASQQANIQESQNMLMKYHQKPVILIRDYKVGSAKEIVNPEGDNDTPFWNTATGIRLSLQNIGDGLAENLRLRCRGALVTETGIISFQEAGILIAGTSLNGDQVNYKVSLMSGRTGSLPSGDTYDFIATPAATHYDGDGLTAGETLEAMSNDDTTAPTPFGRILEEIDLNITTVFFQVEIVYDYLGLFTGDEMLLRVGAEPNDIDTFEDLLELGKPISPEEAEMLVKYLDSERVMS